MLILNQSSREISKLSMLSKSNKILVIYARQSPSVFKANAALTCTTALTTCPSRDESDRSRACQLLTTRNMWPQHVVLHLNKHERKSLYCDLALIWLQSSEQKAERNVNKLFCCAKVTSFTDKLLISVWFREEDVGVKISFVSSNFKRRENSRMDKLFRLKTNIDA